MPSVEYKKLIGVGQICGDYCAWHETSIYCEYIYGHPNTLGDNMGEKVCEELDIELEDLKRITDSEKIKKIDTIVKQAVKDCDGDYCDMEDQTFLCLISDGNIIETYLEVR